MNDPTTNQHIPDKPENLVNSSSIVGYTYHDSGPLEYTLDVWYTGRKGVSLYRYFMIFPVQMAQIFNEGGSVGLKARNSLKGNLHQRLH